MEHFPESIIVKGWEHRTWGNAIYAYEKGFYGCLSNLRFTDLGFTTNCCDLRDGDVIVMDVSRSDNPMTGGKKYEIGFFCNVRVQRDPPDMFFASYLRLGFADDYERETIKELAEYYIKHKRIRT